MDYTKQTFRKVHLAERLFIDYGKVLRTALGYTYFCGFPSTVEGFHFKFGGDSGRNGPPGAMATMYELLFAGILATSVLLI